MVEFIFSFHPEPWWTFRWVPQIVPSQACHFLEVEEYRLDVAYAAALPGRFFKVSAQRKPSLPARCQPLRSLVELDSSPEA